jgi:hypothetical protein
MTRSMRACLLVGALVAVSGAACEKGPTARRSTVSTADVDALWALAPAGTEFGVVASPRALGLLDGAKTRLLANLRAAPELASLAQQVERGLVDELGTSDLSPAAHGLSLDKGFAMFAVKDGRVLVLPVANRDTFISAAKGTKGTDTDTFDDLTCKTIKGVYACAKPASLLDGLGANGRRDGAKLVGARGDVEIAGTAPGPSGPISFAIVGQLDRGALVMRIAVNGIKSLMPMQIVEGAAPRIDADHTTGFAVLDLSTWLAAVPAIPVVPGVTADELAHSVAGPVTATIRAGVNTVDVRLPLSETGAATKLVEQCDQVPPLRALGATVVDGSCHIPIPQMLMEADAWIEGKELRIGKRSGGAAPVRTQLTPIGKELAAHKWPMVMWGRGSIFATPKLPPMGIEQVPEMAAAMIRTFSLLNEMGFAMRMDGDTLHAVISARTAYANPDDVIAKLGAITPEDILAGRAGETAKAIAAASPSSPFAADLAAGYNGLMVPSAAIGAMAAVAIPAFLEYMKKSKVSESALQLNRLAKYLKATYAQNSALPIGAAPLTPATPCCDGPNHKCFDPTAWEKQAVWKQLEFSVDDAHLFRYDYTSTDGKSFVAHAVADLDCDGQVVTYTLSGEPDGDMLKVHMSGPEGTD